MTIPCAKITIVARMNRGIVGIVGGQQLSDAGIQQYVHSRIQWIGIHLLSSEDKAYIRQE